MPLDLEQMKLSGFAPDPDLKWEKIGDVPPPSDGVDANDYNGAYVISVAIDAHRVLVIDQVYGSVHESFVRMFDTRTREWGNEEWPSLNQARVDFGCEMCNGKVYVIGGWNSEGEYLDSIECLDLSASPRQWKTLSRTRTLRGSESKCKAIAIGRKMYFIGFGCQGASGDKIYGIVSVELFDTETDDLAPCLNPPSENGRCASVVGDELLLFSSKSEDDLSGEIYSLRHEEPDARWRSHSVTYPMNLVSSEHVVVLGQCVLPTAESALYDTKRERWWYLPTIQPDEWSWAAVRGTEILAFTNDSVYSLKLKAGVQPPTAVMPTSTAKVNRSMLFSPDFSDVTFVCPGGIEVPAHRNVLAANNAYFRAYFCGPWLEQHPDGRWETNKSSDVIKASLSIMYTGEAPSELSDAHLLELLETVYEFQLDSDLLRICQAKCIENIGLSNVKDFLLSAKLHDASFLLDAAFKFICKHFSEVASDPDVAEDLIKADGELWREIVKSSHKPSRKRQRSRSVVPS